MDQLKSYKEVESFLFDQLPMFQRVGPKAFKKDLKNIQELMNALGNPESKLRCIHIAGTNGKGSCSFLIASLLDELGYRVGLYTSPHYRDYRERIRVNSKMISKSWVRKFVNSLIENGVFEWKLKPSFFEITVAMAFQYFYEQKLDYAVIETGLGGRLDSTNIINPLVSLITNIGLDHTSFLGTTIPEIAGEKAGIIKKKTPVVIGKTQKLTSQIFIEKANEMNAKITFADKQKRINEIESIKDLFPLFQYENLYSAYYCLSQIIPADKYKPALKMAWTKGLLKWGFVGRYMKTSSNPLVILDSAHNQQGIKTLMKQIQLESFKNLHIVLAVVKDKSLDEVLPLYPKEANYYFSNARIPRAMDKNDLQEQAEIFGLKGKAYSGIKKAFAAAKKSASKKDLILVTGSIFTVAELV